MAASKRRDKKGKKGRVKPEPLSTGRIKPDSPPLQPEEIMFSFKYLHPTPPVSQEFPEGYWNALFRRLHDVSRMKLSEFLGSRNDALKAHGIKWEDSAFKDGFPHLNEQLRAYKGYQFSIDRYNFGRVIGFLRGNVFYICWLDPKHETTDSN